MSDPRRIVREAYDAIAANYLAARTTESPDVALLDDVSAQLRPGMRVLDAGCGAGVPITRRLVDDGFHVVGLDVSTGQLELLAALVPAARRVQSDLAALPFADASFDAVVSYYAIIHVPRADHGRLFAEVTRVLRPSGVALLCLGANDNPADNDPESWLGAPMYWSHYDAATNRQLLADAGLTVIDDRIVDDPMSHGHHLFVVVRPTSART